MTATEELRRLLDERGVEWSDLDTRTGDASDYITDWTVPGHGWAVGREIGGHISYTWVMGERFTPEQAIDATLGPGTCREVKIYRYWRGCGECGYVWEFMYGIGECERPRYCPNCGRMVEE